MYMDRWDEPHGTERMREWIDEHRTLDAMRIALEKGGKSYYFFRGAS